MTTHAKVDPERGPQIRKRLIEEGLLSPSGRGRPCLKMREEDNAHARRHLLEYFGQPLLEVEQEQDPTWSRFFAWIAEGDETEKEQVQHGF